MGVVVAVSPNGRGARHRFLIVLCRRSSNLPSHPGKANGSCGGTQLLVYAIDNGIWTSKDRPSALFRLWSH
jgi:hypothetical protein